jgi:hypothetical protein
MCRLSVTTLTLRRDAPACLCRRGVVFGVPWPEPGGRNKHGPGSEPWVAGIQDFRAAERQHESFVPPAGAPTGGARRPQQGQSGRGPQAGGAVVLDAAQGVELCAAVPVLVQVSPSHPVVPQGETDRLSGQPASRGDGSSKC